MAPCGGYLIRVGVSDKEKKEEEEEEEKEEKEEWHLLVTFELNSQTPSDMRTKNGKEIACMSLVLVYIIFYILLIAEAFFCLLLLFCPISTNDIVSII